MGDDPADRGGSAPVTCGDPLFRRDLAVFNSLKKEKKSFDHENWEQAKEQFEHAISIAPSLPYAYYFLGRIAFAHGDHKHAFGVVQKAELLFPHTERAWLEKQQYQRYRL